MDVPTPRRRPPPVNHAGIAAASPAAGGGGGGGSSSSGGGSVSVGGALLSTSSPADPTAGHRPPTYEPFHSRPPPHESSSSSTSLLTDRYGGQHHHHHRRPDHHNHHNTQSPVSLKTTLGLQPHRYAKYIGPTDEHDFALLDLRLYDDTRETPADQGSFRKVGPTEFFHQFADSDHPGQAQDSDDLDRIERIVAPHGRALISLYFSIVHPAYPILEKKTFLQKYDRDYREFSPPILAAVYILALNWWSYSPELAKHAKPDIVELESIAFRTLQVISYRAKLSTVQAGLLLMQRPTHLQAWQLTCQLVGMAQDLGLHLDCSTWKIPPWERALRKRLAWALFMQDTWAALIFGRPPHISLTNWAVQPITPDDFPDIHADVEEADAENEHDDDIHALEASNEHTPAAGAAAAAGGVSSSSEAERCQTLFVAMIALSKMLCEVLEDLYSLKADMHIQHAYDSTKAVLERAKPIQVKLKAWWSDMPDCLRMDATEAGRLNSVGYLHLAYFATEITLHRRILRSLSTHTDPYLVQICRSAAKARLISAMDFFNRLKPEHLQSFWYFSSKFNFALIGTFAGLCFVTSVSQEEAEFYKRRLQEYRWTLRVSNKSAEFLEIASGILESAVGALLKATDSIDSRHLDFPMMLQHHYPGEAEAAATSYSFDDTVMEI